jgi:hypothetical protein
MKGRVPQSGPTEIPMTTELGASRLTMTEQAI